MPTFFNQATLSYNNTTTTSNTVQGEIVQALTMTKTPVSDTYSSDGTVTYAISISNSSASAFTGLTLTDNLGSYDFNTGTLVPLTADADSVRVFINGVPQTAPLNVTSLSPLTITDLSVPGGANVMLLYTADVNQYAPLGNGQSITNTASLAGPGLLDTVDADATINNVNEPLLNITKALEPVSVVENGTITYTFTITNTGNEEADAADNIALSDTFDPALNITSVTLNGTALPPVTGYNYTPANGVFTTVPGAITVPAATFTQDTTTGAWNVAPGTSTLVVTGTI